MSSTTLLDAIVQKPTQKAEASVIWLHGLGVDGHDFEDVPPMLNLPNIPIRHILPHAPEQPVTLNQGMMMRAWYDFESWELDQNEDEQGILKAEKLIQNWIAHESEIVNPNKIILIGFSQGGGMVLHTALRYPQTLAGCAVLSGYLPLSQSVEKHASQANKDLSLFFAHGNSDPSMPFVLGCRARDHLQKLDYQCEFHEYPMGHQVCEDEMIKLGLWIKNCLS